MRVTILRCTVSFRMFISFPLATDPLGSSVPSWSTRWSTASSYIERQLRRVKVKASFSLSHLLGKNSNRKGRRSKSPEKAASDDHVPMAHEDVRESK